MKTNISPISSQNNQKLCNSLHSSIAKLIYCSPIKELYKGSFTERQVQILIHKQFMTKTLLQDSHETHSGFRVDENLIM